MLFINAVNEVTYKRTLIARIEDFLQATMSGLFAFMGTLYHWESKHSGMAIKSLPPGRFLL